MDKSLSNSKQKVETKQVDLDTGMPDLPKKELFAITFAFLGINMAFSLQSSQMSRICQTIGANPNNLGFFFIFPYDRDRATGFHTTRRPTPIRSPPRGGPRPE